MSVFKDNVPLRTADTLTINGEDVLLKIFGKFAVHQSGHKTHMTEASGNRKGL